MCNKLTYRIDRTLTRTERVFIAEKEQITTANELSGKQSKGIKGLQQIATTKIMQKSSKGVEDR